MWLCNIYSGGRGRGEIKHYGRNGRYFVRHKNRKEANENDASRWWRNGRGIIVQMCCTDYHKKQQDDNSPKNYLGFEILTEAHKVKKTPLTWT